MFDSITMINWQSNAVEIWVLLKIVDWLKYVYYVRNNKICFWSYIYIYLTFELRKIIIDLRDRGF